MTIKSCNCIGLDKKAKAKHRSNNMSYDHRGVGYDSPVEPTSSNKDLAGRTLAFLGVPVLFVLTSVFMTTLNFMMSKVEEGETWETLMGWWWSLIAVSPYYTIGVPLIVCTGIIILIANNPWGK